MSTRRSSRERPAAGLSPDLQDLADRLRAGNRRALAKAITLVESTRPDQRAAADSLLHAVLPDAGHALRLGLSGAPGVGKSTFIEAFGKFLTGMGRQVAVLAVDPSSSRTGGSILGDKTRMEALSRDPGAFIRPSPSGGSLGGVARRTREAVLLVEAAGFDVVLVETVGVGQSETAVADMVDMFVLLLSPAGGDDLQGIKRGIMELADLVIVNKADGELRHAANRAAHDFNAALHLMRPKYAGWPVPVAKASALKGEGLEDIWTHICEFETMMAESGRLEKLRADQAKAWMWSEIRDGVIDLVKADHALARWTRKLERQVVKGQMSPSFAAREVLARFKIAAPK